MSVDSRKVQSRALTSPLVIIYVFAGMIAVSTLILLMPFTHHGGGFTPFVVALFTATSAITVTGLTVQESSTYWTTTGQFILTGMIFIGGLGFMSLATFALVIVGQKVTLSQRLLIRESFGGDLLGIGHASIVQLTVRIVLFAVASQLLAFIILAIHFWSIYPAAQAMMMALFQAVSAFNNAGFVFLSEESGLATFKSDGVVMGVTAVMIFLGAISYGVIFDVVRYRRFRLFGLTTKLVLILTVATIVLGTAVFFVFEYRNPQTLGLLPVSQKIATAAFEAVSGRTAGFTTLDYSTTEQETNFMITSLMFIGGASASVAGGIKVNTLAVILVAVISTIRGRSSAAAFGREIPEEQVRRALVLGAISITVVFIVAVSLNITDGALAFLDLFFESVSAFGTVGLSTGITSVLTHWGQLVLVGAMFIGRVGPFTMGIAMAQQGEGDRYRFAHERVTIG